MSRICTYYSHNEPARIEPPTAEATPATSAPMKVMAPVGLAGLWSRRSNAGQRQGSAAAGSAAACSDVRQGKVDAAQRAARRGERAIAHHNKVAELYLHSPKMYLDAHCR